MTIEQYTNKDYVSDKLCTLAFMRGWEDARCSTTAPFQNDKLNYWWIKGREAHELERSLTKADWRELY